MRAMLSIMLIVLSVLIVGCEKPESSTHKFVNNSSYTVNIIPNGQTWVPASISPGSSVKIKWSGTIQFSYSPSNKVKVADNEPGIIIFVNR